MLMPGLLLESDLCHPNTGQILLSRGTVLTEGFVRKIERLGLESAVEASLQQAARKRQGEGDEIAELTAALGTLGENSPAATDPRPGRLQGEPVLDYGLRVEGKMAISNLLDCARGLKDRHEGSIRSFQDCEITWGIAKGFIDHLLARIERMDLDRYPECRLHDAYSFSHPFNTAVLSMLTGEALGQGRDEIRELGLAGLLADIGLAWVPPALLEKSGRLSSQELEQLREHVRHAVTILKEFQSGRGLIVHVAATHHERMDGSGYPRGLEGLGVPDGAQIIGLADTYDAMLSDRPYRKRLEPAVAYQVMVSSPSFSKGVVAAFRRRVSPYPVGTRVQLSSGQEAEIVEVNPDKPLRPVLDVDGARIDLAAAPELRVTRHVVPRRYTRLAHRLPVQIRTRAGHEWNATTVDLSLEGLGLEGDRTPPHGEKLFLTVTAGGQPVHVVGQVVWEGARSGDRAYFAVSFVPSSDADQRQLVDAIWSMA